MENRGPSSLQELFSRGNTPPQQQQQAPAQFIGPHFPNDTSASSHLDSLLHQLTAPMTTATPDQHTPQPQTVNQPAEPYGKPASANPATNVPDEPVAPAASQSTPTAAERQNALLSLLAGPPQSATARSAPATSGSLPPQASTPPGPPQRNESAASHNEAQGKILLEQLMSGNPPRTNYSDVPRNSSAGAAPSPPFVQSDFRLYGPLEQGVDISRAGPQPAPPQQQQPVPAPASPPKSMFDFISPFDHLSSASSAVKKKPVPTQPSNTASPNEDPNWAVIDPKRASVDNLLEHLTRGQIPPTSQAPPPAYDSYLIGGEYVQHDQSQVRQPGPPTMPGKGVHNRPSSPRASPKNQAPQNQQSRPQPLPPVPQQPVPIPPQPDNPNARRDKETSPIPNGSRINNKGGKGSASQAKSITGKVQSSPRSATLLTPGFPSEFVYSPQTQTIVFDVSLPLEEIQAPRDSVKSTAIALVKQESVFLPGTTIGATHWVAYAMTRGRVRVISRTSGDRTLLQLPNTIFSPQASVTDMAVYGNRLAGVTSDGGFVIWELPPVITDDVPGRLILIVHPSQSDADALQSVKWHPKEPDTVAVTSRDKLYLLDLVHTQSIRGDQPIPQPELAHFGQVFHLSSPLAAFDFDVMHYALATISEDSTLTIWNTQDRVPYTSNRIRGEDTPSSLTFVDGGIVVGRKNGTVFQLLSISTKQIMSTVRFVNGNQEDPDMFGHVTYDSRIQSLWIANCRRESMIALKLNIEQVNGGDDVRCTFDQVVEFSGPKPTIHFVILTGDADPHGDEALAACIAAKVPPGELALVAFSVHSSGVDQVLIRKEWFNAALSLAPNKLPPHPLPQIPQPPQNLPPVKTARPQPPIQHQQVQPPQHGVIAQHTVPPPANFIPPRPRTPTSEEAEGELSREEGRVSEQQKGSKGGPKGKGVNHKEAGEKQGRASDSGAALNETSLGQAIAREIKKSEESLHTKIGRLIGKEMEKQNQRLEDARAHEQAEDFARQEKILKLISTELTKNTTRVVEVAVKTEVQNSVLPSLEAITRNEVKAALNDQIGRGLVDTVNQSLPVEIEKLILRHDISGHFAHLLTSNLTPLIERQIKDSVAKSLVSVYSQQTTAMHQDLLREVRSELHNIKTELTAWQNEAFRTHENAIRDLEHTVRTLSDQVKYLSMGGPPHHLQQSQQSHNSPGPHVPVTQPPPQSHLRQQNLPPTGPTNAFNLNHGAFQPPPPQQPSVMHPTWYPTNLAAPQASHPATIPQPPPQPQPPQDRSPPIKADQWDELYLSVLHTQDIGKLRDLLSRTNPELIMPLNGPPLVSQAVVLTLVHRLSAMIGDSSPGDESFKTSLWWLQRSVAVLRPEVGIRTAML
ncbi:hypothetical protein AX16_003742 [Volvariella volvacea WC 439]|nr:hypothetical protein AX16_003742 [Volvariella volvacea WC 439]